MRKIELVQGISSSVLGFGCAPVLGSIGAEKSASAIDCAIDYGINHFDIARSYGYGEAERFVGKIIKSRRDKLILSSKFGIKANWKAKLLRPAKPFLRYVFKKKPVSSPGERYVSNTRLNFSDNFHNRVILNGKEMRNSLEKSLKELGTDYLDYFFIHEPAEKLFCIEELALTADLLKKEGKIRAWGLAYMRDKEQIHQSYLNSFDVLQFNLSPGTYGYEKVLKERSNKPNILFSPFRGGPEEMNPGEKLHKLLTEFDKSVILCSMFNKKHIQENVSLAG